MELKYGQATRPVALAAIFSVIFAIGLSFGVMTLLDGSRPRAIFLFGQVTLVFASTIRLAWLADRRRRWFELETNVLWLGAVYGSVSIVAAHSN